MQEGNALGNLNFILPTLSSADMPKDEQGAILVNQATTIIITAWLAHRNVAMQVMAGTNSYSITAGDNVDLRVDRNELVQAVNEVQDALKGF